MIRRWTSAELTAEARKRHQMWLASTDPVETAIAGACTALAWAHVQRAEIEEETRPTWPRISLKEVGRE